MKWMKVDAACSRAGGVHRKTIYAAVATGKLKVARIGAGRNLLFSDVWIDEWLMGSHKDESPATGGTRAGLSERD